MPEDTLDFAELTVEVVSSYVANHTIRPEEVPAFIAATHAAIAGLGKPAEAEPAPAASPEHTPAVTARKSLASKDHIVSMIDGKSYKTLRRHLSTHGLTPAEYRERYGLKPDYPMVAESYSATRRELAQKIGLGRKVKSAAASVVGGALDTLTEALAPAAETAPEKPKRGRKPKAAPAPAGDEAPAEG